MTNLYPKNFLNQVIIRIDFSNPIEELRSEIPKKLNTKALKFFPILEPRDAYLGHLSLEITAKDSEDVPQFEKKKMKDWIYFGKDREKELHINVDALFIVYTKYESYKQLHDDFIAISEPLFSEFETFGIKRIGLRYINIISLSEANPTNWKKYLNKNLLCTFNLCDNQKIISRAFHVLELKIEDIQLRFQYGMHNRDYPAIIRKKEFVLDFDAYFEGLIQNPSEINSYLEKCRKPIKKLFEGCILDPLRDRMK